MKTRPLIIAGLALMVLVFAGVLRHSSRSTPAVRVTGPLATNDVVEISQLVLSERAPLLLHAASPKDAAFVLWQLRKRVAGQLRSIASTDGRTAVVAFADKWDRRLSYNYDLERTTNGWRIVAVGWRRGGTNE